MYMAIGKTKKQPDPVKTYTSLHDVAVGVITEEMREKARKVELAAKGEPSEKLSNARFRLSDGGNSQSGATLSSSNRL